MSVTVGPDQRVSVSSTGVIGAVAAIPPSDSWLLVASEPFSQQANQTLYPNYLSSLIYLMEAQITFENPSVTTRQDVQAKIVCPSPATYILGPCLVIDSIITSGARSISSQSFFAVISMPSGTQPAPVQLLARGIGVRHKIAADSSGFKLAYLTSSLEGPVLIVTTDTPANKALSLSQQTVFSLSLKTSTSADLYYRVKAVALVEQDYTTAAPPKITLSLTGQNGLVSAITTMPVPATNSAPVVQRSLSVEAIVKVAKVSKTGASTVSCPINIVSTLADGTSKLIGAKQDGAIVTYALATA